MTDTLPVRLTGKTRHYKGNGRKLGYPTANIGAATDLTDGVYFGFADFAGQTHQPTLIFIGVPTTVGDKERRVEAHVLDIADIDYYDNDLSLDVLYFHRPNETFGSIDELLKVMSGDMAAAREWFAAHA